MATTVPKSKKTRKLKAVPKRWYQIKRAGPKPAMARMPKSSAILKQALRIMRNNKWLFVKILLVFAILNLLLVRGFSGSSDAQYIKSNLVDAVQGSVDKFSAGVGVAAYLFTSSGNTVSEVAGVYQSILLIVVSLAIIWTIRHRTASQETALTMRDAYYNGMTPLVPFICVLLLVGAALIPIAIGATIYATVVGYQIFNNVFEYGVWLALFLATAAISLRLVVAPLIALYIVTLPNMTPIQAINSAANLVRWRRWSILLKSLYLIAFLLIVGIAIIIPVIFVYAPAAPWVFYAMTMVAILLIHNYFYALYRELINNAP